MEIKELKNFEKNLVKIYLNKGIRSPIHLSGGNEQQLIKIFKKVQPEDWIFTTYRSHYHALLKGMPQDDLLQWILENKSIHLMNKEHKIVSSAIVGGCLPQAVGTAMAIKRKGGKEKVWCFIGDMTASLGIFHDCWRYSLLNDLPITFVIEDNGLSTDTPTKQAWCPHDFEFPWEDNATKKIIYYKYKRIYPHYGVGKFVDFT